MSQSPLARVRSRAGARWAALKRRRASLRHTVSAWQLLQRNHGNQYAAAITFFSFLALFPLLLLVVSITGFVLHSDPSLEREFFRHLTDNVPGALGRTLKSSLRAAIDSRASLGVVGLIGVLLTGLGWIGNMRAAIDGVWGHAPAKLNFVKARIANLFVLAGLGVGAVVSIGLTVIGTSLTDQIVRALGLDDLPGAQGTLKLVGTLLAIAGDTIIFWWLLVRLPQMDVPALIAVKGAVLTAVGFEVLKVVATYTITHTANSPTAGPFASVIAILIWLQLVARWMLFGCAWTATLTSERRVPAANQAPVEEPTVMAEQRERTAEVSPAAVGATLVGAGVIAGAAATWALTRPHHGDG